MLEPMDEQEFRRQLLRVLVVIAEKIDQTGRIINQCSRNNWPKVDEIMWNNKDVSGEDL